MQTRKILYIVLLAILVVSICLTNYFMSILSRVNPPEATPTPASEAAPSFDLDELVDRFAEKYPPKGTDEASEAFLAHVLSQRPVDRGLAWLTVRQWTSRELLYEDVPQLGELLRALRQAEITHANEFRKGSQLKLALKLDNKINVIFKPKWYDKSTVIGGPSYAGKDRHGAEILAFYLSGLLGVHKAPVAVQRAVSISREIEPAAAPFLKQTLFRNGSSACIYGLCRYCKREDPICEEADGLVRGAVILRYPWKITSHASPWQRSYTKEKAKWQLDKNYCVSVKKKISQELLLNFIDLAIFDFIMQNGDRHHYDMSNNQVLYLDNGKGLGNPHKHDMDILAPLHQCCLLRSYTWERLQRMSGGELRRKLESIPEVRDIVSSEHLKAMEKRILIIFSIVEWCKEKKKSKNL